MAAAPSPPAANLPPLQRSVEPAEERWQSSSTRPLITLLEPMKRATNSERGRS
jgi:hypothetical protein